MWWETEKNSIYNTPALQAPITALTSAAFALEVLGKTARLGNSNHMLFLLPPWASPAMLIPLSHYLHWTLNTALLFHMENIPMQRYSLWALQAAAQTHPHQHRGTSVPPKAQQTTPALFWRLSACNWTPCFPGPLIPVHYFMICGGRKQKRVCPMTTGINNP